MGAAADSATGGDGAPPKPDTTPATGKMAVPSSIDLGLPGTDTKKVLFADGGGGGDSTLRGAGSEQTISRRCNSTSMTPHEMRRKRTMLNQEYNQRGTAPGIDEPPAGWLSKLAVSGWAASGMTASAVQTIVVSAGFILLILLCAPFVEQYMIGGCAEGHTYMYTTRGESTIDPVYGKRWIALVDKNIARQCIPIVRCDVSSMMFGKGRNCEEEQTIDVDSLIGKVVPFMTDNLGKSHSAECQLNADHISSRAARACFKNGDVDESDKLDIGEFRRWFRCMNVTLACHADLCA